MLRITKIHRLTVTFSRFSGGGCHLRYFKLKIDYLTLKLSNISVGGIHMYFIMPQNSPFNTHIMNIFQGYNYDFTYFWLRINRIHHLTFKLSK